MAGAGDRGQDDAGHPGRQSRLLGGRLVQSLQEGPALLLCVMVSRERMYYEKGLYSPSRLLAARGSSQLQAPQRSLGPCSAPRFPGRRDRCGLITLCASISGKITLRGSRGRYSWTLRRSAPCDLISQHRQRMAWPPWETQGTGPLAPRCPLPAGVNKTTASVPAAVTTELDGLRQLEEGSGKSRSSVNTPPLPCPAPNCCHPPDHRASRAGRHHAGKFTCRPRHLVGRKTSDLQLPEAGVSKASGGPVPPQSRTEAQSRRVNTCQGPVRASGGPKAASQLPMPRATEIMQTSQS